jgi:hypothetical protein
MTSSYIVAKNMPEPEQIDPSTAPPIGMRQCPVCARPMFLSLIEPTYQDGYDIRTFECLACDYDEIALTNFAK